MSEKSAAQVVTMVNRHKESEGFCQCDGQPWPCDLKILSDFFKGWRSKI